MARGRRHGRTQEHLSDAERHAIVLRHRLADIRSGERSNIPDARIGSTSPQAKRRKINRTAKSQDSRINITSGANQWIPELYGKCSPKPHMFAVGMDGPDLIFGLWCGFGEIEEYTEILINGAAVPGAVTVEEYKGTTVQGVSPILSNLSGYAHDLVIDVNGTDRGMAYLAFRVPPGAVDGFPKVSVKIKGNCKIEDTRTATTAYSDVPALCWRHWIKTAGAGPEWPVNDSSFEALADFNEEVPGDVWIGIHNYSLLDFAKPTGANPHSRVFEVTTDAGLSGAGEPAWNFALGATTNDGGLIWTCRDGRRHVCGVITDVQADIDSWMETWRTLCGCMYIFSETGIEAIPDHIRATDHVFKYEDGQIQNNLALKQTKLRDRPTVVQITYTNTQAEPWRDATVRVAAAGVDAGTTRERLSSIKVPGIHRTSQAIRLGIERLNAATLTDLSFPLHVFDEGLRVRAGDVIEVTDPIGLTDKKMRVLDAHTPEPGRWLLDLWEYDPAVYSNHVETESTYPDFDLNSGAGAKAQSAGSGINVCHGRYSVFEEPVKPPTHSVNGTVSLNPAISYFGNSSLKMAASAADHYCYLGANGIDYNSKISPNKKWIVSVYNYCNQASKDIDLYVKTSDAPAYTKVEGVSHGAAFNWKRVSGVIDLSSDDSTTCIIRLDNDGGAGCDMHFDGVMLEEQVGDLTEPSAFALPSGIVPGWDSQADETATSSFVTSTYPADQSDIQDQIDGKIVSWFQVADPQLTWSGTDASHVGDMWWNTSTNQLKRWDGAAWSSVIEDQKAIDAYANAADAQDTADGKRRVFTAQPTTPYDVGDLWSAGPSGDIKKCKTARGSGAYQAGDWELASEYTEGATWGSNITDQPDDALLLNELNCVGGYQGVPLPDETGCLNRVDCYINNPSASYCWFKVAEFDITGDYKKATWNGLFSHGSAAGGYTAQMRVQFAAQTDGAGALTDLSYVYSGVDRTTYLRIAYVGTTVTVYAHLDTYQSCLFDGAWSAKVSSGNSWIHTKQNHTDNIGTGTPAGTFLTPTKNYTPGADITVDNTANNANNYTGNSITTGYTAAKCTDADADETITHKALDTLYINGSINQSGQGNVQIYDDLQMRDTDISFYVGGTYKGGIYGTADGLGITGTGDVRLVANGGYIKCDDTVHPTSDDGANLGRSTRRWLRLYVTHLDRPYSTSSRIKMYDKTTGDYIEEYRYEFTS